MVKFKGPEGRAFMQTLLEDQSGLESELGHSVRFDINDVTVESDRVVGMLVVEYKAQGGVEVDAEQMTWLLKMANTMVNALRPRLAASVA